CVVKCLLPLVSTNVIQSQVLQSTRLFVWVLESLCALQDGFFSGLLITPPDEVKCDILVNKGIAIQSFLQISSSFLLEMREKICSGSTNVISAFLLIKADRHRVCLNRLSPVHANGLAVCPTREALCEPCESLRFPGNFISDFLQNIRLMFCRYYLQYLRQDVC